MKKVTNYKQVEKELPNVIIGLKYFFLLVIAEMILNLPILDFIKHIQLDSNKFEVKLTEDNTYALYIDDNYYNEIDYNEYIDNIKMSFLCNQIKDIVVKISIILIIIPIYLLTKKIIKYKEPFKNYYLKYLRYSGEMCLTMSFMPTFIYLGARLILVGNIQGDIFKLIDMLPLVMGTIIILFERLYQVAISLKEDNDLIA